MKRYLEHRVLMNVEIGQMVYVDATAFENIDYDSLLATAKEFIN